MLIRLGIPTSFRRLSAVAKELGAPVLVSANAFRSRAGGFRKVSADLFSGCDVALDSAGFVAMVRYGGYPWTVAEYVRLAKAHPWAWWAAMDFCCEPQVAADRAVVRRRVQETAQQLRLCQEEAQRQAAAPCMPVLQGWAPDDYLECFDLMAGLESQGHRSRPLASWTWVSAPAVNTIDRRATALLQSTQSGSDVGLESSPHRRVIPSSPPPQIPGNGPGPLRRPLLNGYFSFP